jgi:diguanylate cyclase (GGDEF)-like protein/PAS domain S-box-containing protein
MSKNEINDSNIDTLSEVDYRQLSIMQQAIFDGANYSIISTDVDGTIRSFNNAASRVLGYSPGEVIGRSTPALFHDPEEVAERAIMLSRELGETIEPGFEVFVAKARRGIVEELEWSYIHKDGSRFPVLLSITALRDESGSINGFLGIAFDITERVLIKRALREEEERYRQLFEKSGDSIFLMKDGHFIDCNPATLTMFGCTREQIINQTPYRYSPEYQPDGRLSEEKALEKISAALDGRTQLFEWQHCRYDGTRFDAEVRLKVIEIEARPHLLATVRDISDRKVIERELENSRSELLSRNESLQLINNLSNRLHGSHSIQTIVDETLDALLGLTQTTHLAIYLMDNDENLLRLRASHGFNQTTLKVGETIPLKGSLSGYALAQGEIIFSEEFSVDERVEPRIKQALLASGVHSGVVVPLINQGMILGSINLIYEHKREFTANEKETLDVIRHTVSLSLANAYQVNDLEFMAHHDSLTGLSNRTFFHKAFAEKIASPGFTSAVLLLLDLDRFKEVNDTLGHHIGDKLLREIGPRLERVFTDQEILLSRLGGDEFTVLIDGAFDKKMVLHFSEMIINSLREPIMVDSMKLEIDASIGIAQFPGDGKDSHELLRSADVAMYEAKHKGGGIVIYDRTVDKHTPERLALISELNSAIREGQLKLHYQPKIDLKSGKVSGFEALVRWQHKDMGLLYPDKFIPLAEVSDSIHYLTSEVLHLALQQQKQWFDAGYHLPVAVNLSARNLIDNRCITVLCDLIKKYDVKPGMLELELTETALMHDPETAVSLLRQISGLGIKLSIDDFGTGYSSLSYLRRMPIDALKIDTEFVINMLSNEQDSIIVRSTIALAHNLNLKVVAEGVENGETMKRLKEMGCDLVQGYFISEPKPWSEIESRLDDYS